MQNILDFSDIECLPKREIIAGIEWDARNPTLLLYFEFLGDYFYNSCFWVSQLRLLILCFLRNYSNGLKLSQKVITQWLSASLLSPHIEDTYLTSLFA